MAKKGFSGKNIENVPEGPGVYKLYNSQDSITYVGKTKNLQERLQQHLNEEDIPNIRRFETEKTATTKEAETKEKNLIQRHKPIHNIKDKE